ncbi:MAG: hypothetical protein AAGA08_09630 [Pseudomonadota bacterium]
MSGRDWFDRFVADGPGYAAHRVTLAEMQALLLKAGRGAGLPLGHAQDLSALAPLLMSDPQLLAMAVAALDSAHRPARLEGTDEHAVVEAAEVLMAGPVVVDALVAGAKRVVLHNMDWPLLLWPYLAHAQVVYGQCVALTAEGKGTVMITPASRDTLDTFPPPGPVPDVIMQRLNGFAAKTYVPATEASRAAGAGAGLTDND